MARDVERSTESLTLSGMRGLRHVQWQPPVDIYQLPAGWLIKYELAGVRPQDLQLRVRGRCLVLQGVRRDCRIEESQRSYSMEISYNEFERTLELPCDIEPMTIQTNYQDGMLIVRLANKVPNERG